jgi:DNA ligase-1
MKHRELVMLAENTAPESLSLGSWLLSEKADGIRALWLPLTRGIPVTKINFANTDRKGVGRPIVATGLWSRYGNILPAPDWWLDMLPNFPLDGELYMGRGTFQVLTGMVKRYVSNSDWKDVKYLVFDAPSYAEVFRVGRINNPNYQKLILAPEYTDWQDIREPRFEFRYGLLRAAGIANETVRIHHQTRLHWRSSEAYKEMHNQLKSVLSQGGEGVILRAPHSTWEPIRSKLMVKVKAMHDSEARVVGYNPGQGRLAGMTGSLQVDWEGIRFDLSGFTDQERKDAPRLFPVGTLVTFSYRELTADGKPKEARYLRKRDPGI